MLSYLTRSINFTLLREVCTLYYKNSLIHKQYSLMIPCINVLSSPSGSGQPLDEQHCVTSVGIIWAHTLTICAAYFWHLGSYCKQDIQAALLWLDTDVKIQIVIHLNDREIPDAPCSVLHLEWEGRGGAGGCRVVVVVVLWRTAFVKFSKHVTLSPTRDVPVIQSTKRFNLIKIYSDIVWKKINTERMDTQGVSCFWCHHVDCCFIILLYQLFFSISCNDTFQPYSSDKSEVLWCKNESRCKSETKLVRKLMEEN